MSRRVRAIDRIGGDLKYPFGNVSRRYHEFREREPCLVGNVFDGGAYVEELQLPQSDYRTRLCWQMFE